MVPAANVPGWETDDANNQIEIWTSGSVNGVISGEGDQHIELNNRAPGSIWQDFATTDGDNIRWSFLYRARGPGLEQVEVLIGAPGALVSQGVFTGTLEWTEYGASLEIPPGQTTTRIAIKALTPSASLGNLIDAVSVEIYKIPTLGEWGIVLLFLSLIILGVVGIRQKKLSLQLLKG